LAIIPFDTEQDAIEIANNTNYGLSGYVQTANLRRALLVAEELNTGEVLINRSPNLMSTVPMVASVRRRQGRRPSRNRGVTQGEGRG
jgi:aldehyde dehydrogenase (NAD+)